VYQIDEEVGGKDAPSYIDYSQIPTILNDPAEEFLFMGPVIHMGGSH
jgi:hypothetical protein